MRSREVEKSLKLTTTLPSAYQGPPAQPAYAAPWYELTFVLEPSLNFAEVAT